MILKVPYEDEPRLYDFNGCSALSRGVCAANNMETIQSLIPGCIKVEQTEAGDLRDKYGIDYIATLRRGREINIDAKIRDLGCSRWWHKGCPELALEKWSVMAGGVFKTPPHRGKCGWTLSEQSLTEMVFFHFHPQDTREVFLLPFQALRIAFRTNIADWFRRYKHAIQRTYKGRCWESEAVFVPFDVVWEAIRKVCRSSVG